MTQAPTAPTTSRGYQPPYVRQFSVFLPNKVGRLLDLIDVFDGHQVTLAGLNIQDSTDHAVVRLVTSNSELTRRLLIREDFRFSMMDVACVELNADQTLLDVCRCLLEVELNLYYTYPLLVRPRRLPVIALYADDMVFAGQVLRKKLFHLLGENDLGLNATGTQTGNPTDAALGRPTPGKDPDREQDVTGTAEPHPDGGTSLDDVGDASEAGSGGFPPDDVGGYEPGYDPETDGQDYPDLPGEDDYGDLLDPAAPEDPAAPDNPAAPEAPDRADDPEEDADDGPGRSPGGGLNPN